MIFLKIEYLDIKYLNQIPTVVTIYIKILHIFLNLFIVKTVNGTI